jgi:phenylacetate-CoA ligase
MSATATAIADRGAIESAQLNALRAMLAELARSNAFYKDRLAAAGVDAEVGSLAEFTQRMPFTRKSDIVEDQLRNPPYGANLTYPLERYVRFAQTSATTGRPLRWLDTPESWEWMLDCWERVFQAGGVTSRDRIFFAFSFGPFLGFWTAFGAATRMGCLSLPGGGMRSVDRLAAMIDNRATVLCCTPTYALRLAEVAAEEGIDLSRSSIRRIIVAGEPGGSIAATRAQIEASWPGAQVADHHGMTEIGPVTYECPKRSAVLHVMELAYIPEVIDTETLEPVKPGSTGELVLTNLGRPGSPLLRYRTGDTVRRDAAVRCECGSCEMALPGGILGRNDDMVVVRGVNVYPSAIEDVVRSCGGIAEYRVEVRTARALAELQISVEPLAGHAADGLAHRLEMALHGALGLRIPVMVLGNGSLPRFEMKARRWVKV